MSDSEEAARRVVLLNEIEDLERKRRSLEVGEPTITFSVIHPSAEQKLAYSIDAAMEERNGKLAEIADRQKLLLAELGLLPGAPTPGDNIDGVVSSPLVNDQKLDLESVASAKVRAMKMYEAALQKAANPTPAETKPTMTASADFTTVNWGKQRFTFHAGNQAKAIELLWKAWKDGGHGLSEKTIGEQIGSSDGDYRLAFTFRISTKRKSGRRAGNRKSPMHPAWRTMIQRVRAGVYRLVEPESRKNHV